MSHLSQIKTKIHNVQILKKTLNELGFIYQLQENSEFDLIVMKDKYYTFAMIWNGQEYSIVADLEMWTSNIYIDSLIDKITQQYSYNTIIEESAKYGFTNVNKELMRDGSIKLIVQRWN